MTSYNFTEQVRRSLALAREHAHALKHEYVGTEHMLLGLLDDDGIPATIFERKGVAPDRIELLVKMTVKEGKAGDTRSDLPYTARAKRVLEFSMREARDLNHNYVGTEHLLLGLLREGNGIAAEVLTSVGITIEDARTETLRQLGIEADQIRPAPPETQSSIPLGKPNHVMVVLMYPSGDSRAKTFKSAHDAISYIGQSFADHA
jgi:ATP-dependent Clp protease ATP-binding subunit ClpC